MIMENTENKESALPRFISPIIALIVIGGFYLFGQIFSVIVISLVILSFIVMELRMSEETKERRLKSWGKTSLLYVIFKLITFQKPKDAKEGESRIFIGLVIIGLLAGIVWTYYSYFAG